MTPEADRFLRKARKHLSRYSHQTRHDSDYDVAVFLKDLNDRWAEADKIALAAMNVFDETGALIHAMPYREGAYQDRTPLMHEVRREGIDL